MIFNMEANLEKKIEEFIARVYKIYPKKMGKAKGAAKLKLLLHTEEDCASFFAALQRYINYLNNNRTEQKYIMYFSTFVNNWTDWDEDDAGTCLILPKKEDFSDLFNF